MKDLTTKKFWESGYVNLDLTPMPEDYPIVKELRKAFSPSDKNVNSTGQNINKGRSIFEIGCFPGRFLYHFGKWGFNLNGADQTDHLDELTTWFKKENFDVGDFIQGDIFKVDIEKSKKYDVVFSSGFVEHFTNFEEVISMHARFVNDHGYIFLTAPNFAGSVQKKLHSYLDDKNLSAHHLPAMDVEVWSKVLKNEGFDIIKAGYLGGFDFWVAPQDNPFYKKFLVKLLRVFMPIRFVPDNRAYSPVARTPNFVHESCIITNNIYKYENTQNSTRG